MLSDYSEMVLGLSERTLHEPRRCFQIRILKKLLMYGLETGEDISSIEKNIRRCRCIYWISSILGGFMFLIWLASAIILYPLYTFPLRWLMIYLLVGMLIVVGIFVSCIVAVFFWLRADILDLRKLLLEGENRLGE